MEIHSEFRISSVVIEQHQEPSVEGHVTRRIWFGAEHESIQNRVGLEPIEQPHSPVVTHLDDAV